MGKPCRIADRNRMRRIGIFVSSLDELMTKAQKNFGIIKAEMKVVLESDGTEVMDEGYFDSQEANTCFVILKKEDDWSRSMAEGLQLSDVVALLLLLFGRGVANNRNSGTVSTSCSTKQLGSILGEVNSSFDKFFEGQPITRCIRELCTHVYCVQPVPESGINIQAACAVCNSTDENWICLTCYEVRCSRFVNKHMMKHAEKSKHKLTLSLKDVKVWCYSCNAYVCGDVMHQATKISWLLNMVCREKEKIIAGKSVLQL